MGIPIDTPVLFCENGLRFEVDPFQGQKTGFFLDQRDNRARVESLVGGCSVLNIFAYTGGFSLYAARGGARQVISLDRSHQAGEMTQRNFAHNRQHPAVAASQHEVIVDDAFGALEKLRSQHRLFDFVIVDPPAMAKEQAQIKQARAAYRRLTRLSLSVLRSEGHLVFASCSSRIQATEFFALLHQAASDAGRTLHEIERTGHALDHPIRFPEGAYLKCLFAKT